MNESHPPMIRRNVTREQVENGQLRIFNSYMRNLGLKEDDLKGKSLLDVGASSGGFGDVAVRFGAVVVSVDSSRPEGWQDVVKGDSKKLFEVSAEKLVLKDKLGLNQEPQFDMVFSHYSTPYILVNNGQDAAGRWKEQKPLEELNKYLYDHSFSSLENIFLHLKSGGKAIVYPLFLDLDNTEAVHVDFGNGEHRNVLEFNTIIHNVLNDLKNKYQNHFDLRLEKVPQPKEGYDLTRLVVLRRPVISRHER